jgi:hypothetical protein
MFFVLNKPSPRRGVLTGHRQLFSLTGSSGAAVFCIERCRHVLGSSPPSLSASSHHIHDRFAAAFVGPPHPRSSRHCLWLESPPGSRRRCIRDGFLSSLGSARRGRLGSARCDCLGSTSSSFALFQSVKKRGLLSSCLPFRCDLFLGCFFPRTDSRVLKKSLCRFSSTLSPLLAVAALTLLPSP